LAARGAAADRDHHISQGSVRPKASVYHERAVIDVVERVLGPFAGDKLDCFSPCVALLNESTGGVDQEYILTIGRKICG